MSVELWNFAPEHPVHGATPGVGLEFSQPLPIPGAVRLNWRRNDEREVKGIARGAKVRILYTEGAKTCEAELRTRDNGDVFEVAESQVIRRDFFVFERS